MNSKKIKSTYVHCVWCEDGAIYPPTQLIQDPKTNPICGSCNLPVTQKSHPTNSEISSFINLHVEAIEVSHDDKNIRFTFHGKDDFERKAVKTLFLLLPQAIILAEEVSHADLTSDLQYRSSVNPVPMVNSLGVEQGWMHFNSIGSSAHITLMSENGDMNSAICLIILWRLIDKNIFDIILKRKP